MMMRHRHTITSRDHVPLARVSLFIESKSRMTNEWQRETRPIQLRRNSKEFSRRMEHRILRFLVSLSRAGFEETGVLSLNFLSTIRFLDRNGKWREIFSEENLLECVSVGLSSGCVELRHTQEKIPRFLRRREETIVQVDEKKEARCDYSHAPPWGITSHSRQCAGSNRPRFCFGKDGSLKIVAWLRIIPNEPATISESDATCLHARRVSLSFSLPRHFRRLFSCYTSRAWLRMYNVSRHPQHTHARTRVVLVRRKFQISRAADERGLGGGRGEQREDILGVQCAHVSETRGKGSVGRGKNSVRTSRDRRFPWDPLGGRATGGP